MQYRSRSSRRAGSYSRCTGGSWKAGEGERGEEGALSQPPPRALVVAAAAGMRLLAEFLPLQRNRRLLLKTCWLRQCVRSGGGGEEEAHALPWRLVVAAAATTTLVPLMLGW